MNIGTALKHKIGIMIGITVCDRPVTPEWALTLTMLEYPIGCSHSVVVVKGLPIDEARCLLAEGAIEMKCKYLFFLDDDVVPAPIILKRLYKILDKDRDVAVAAGIYSPRQDPQEPMVFEELGKGPKYNWKYGDIFECKGIATGAMMIRVDALKNIPKPWFKTVNEDPNGELSSFAVTDDLYFCQKVSEAGYKIMADGGSLCSHWDAINHKEYKLLEFYPPEEKEKLDAERRVGNTRFAETETTAPVKLGPSVREVGDDRQSIAEPEIPRPIGLYKHREEDGEIDGPYGVGRAHQAPQLISMGGRQSDGA